MLNALTSLEIFFAIAIILVSVAAHEAMHAYAAHVLGDTTASDEGRLTLNPLKHIDLFTTILLPVVLLFLHLPPIFIAKPVPFNPENVKYGEYGSALVALAGPFTNLLLAFFGAATARLLGFSGMTFEITELFVYINALFFVFNMIPFPPLDGSRLLYAFAPDSVRRVMSQIESAGLLVFVTFVLLFMPVIGPVVSNITRSIFHFLLR